MYIDNDRRVDRSIVCGVAGPTPFNLTLRYPGILLLHVAIHPIKVDDKTMLFHDSRWIWRADIISANGHPQ